MKAIKEISMNTAHLLISFSLSFLLLFCAGPQANDEKGEGDWMLGPFTKVDSVNPCLQPMGALGFDCPLRGERVRWAVKDVFNPAVVARDSLLWMIFRAEDSVGRHAGTSRLGLAVSRDGLHFDPLPDPIFYPEEDAMKIYEWEGGCEDPRIVEDDEGRYIMTYTAYDGKTARLCVASSSDLYRWTKHGLAFGEGYRDLWSKSGAIVCRREGNRLVAEKINGKYWMYWGDKNIHLAVSDDLLQWEPVSDGNAPKVILPFRPGFFDSDLVEPGPPAILTGKGILMIYNGRNYGEQATPDLPQGTYSAGQALFSRDDPSALLDRSETPFFLPERDYEVSGQVNRVVFLEGLAFFRERWFLYYGTADSRIAVAIN